MTTLQLPEPKVLSMPLGEALQKRRTNRDCTDAALSDDELAALLWACAGRRGPRDGLERPPH